MQLTRQAWGKAREHRKEKYQFWLERGFTPEQAYKARDWSFDRAKADRPFVGPPSKKIKKAPKRKQPWFRGDKELWKELTKYWHIKDPVEKKAKYLSFDRKTKIVSTKWYREAVKWNIRIWNEMSPMERAILKYDKQSALNFSGGYIIVYRRYIRGFSENRAAAGIGHYIHAETMEVLDFEEPEEY